MGRGETEREKERERSEEDLSQVLGSLLVSTLGEKTTKV